MLGGVFSSPSNHWIWVHPWCHNVGWPWWWISSSPAQTNVRRWPVRQLLLRKPTDLTTCSTWSCWSLKMRQVNKGKEKKTTQIWIYKICMRRYHPQNQNILKLESCPLHNPLATLRTTTSLRALSVAVALLANWMGPPKRANLPVFSWVEIGKLQNATHSNHKSN